VDRLISLASLSSGTLMKRCSTTLAAPATFLAALSSPFAVPWIRIVSALVE